MCDLIKYLRALGEEEEGEERGIGRDAGWPLSALLFS